MQGHNENDEQIFAYLLILEKNLKAFQKALTKGDVDISKHGLIVASGKGKPTAKFEQDLIASLKKKG